jgi:hypothetical protein
MATKLTRTRHNVMYVHYPINIIFIYTTVFRFCKHCSKKKHPSLHLKNSVHFGGYMLIATINISISVYLCTLHADRKMGTGNLYTQTAPLMYNSRYLYVTYRHIIWCHMQVNTYSLLHDRCQTVTAHTSTAHTWYRTLTTGCTYWIKSYYCTVLDCEITITKWHKLFSPPSTLLLGSHVTLWK